MPTLRFPDDAVEVVLFARVLREVFKGERWEDVEPSARRAWKQIAPITGLEWEQVREAVHPAHLAVALRIALRARARVRG